jgi:hypothetical protein
MNDTVKHGPINVCGVKADIFAGFYRVPNYQRRELEALAGEFSKALDIFRRFKTLEGGMTGIPKSFSDDVDEFMRRVRA